MKHVVRKELSLKSLGMKKKAPFEWSRTDNKIGELDLEKTFELR